MSDNADEPQDAVLDQAAQSMAAASQGSGASGGTRASGGTGPSGAAGATVGDLTGFLRAYYRHAAAEDLTAFGAERVAAVAARHAALAAKRPQGRALVHVADADEGTPGADGAPAAVTALGPVRMVVDIVTDDMPFLVDSVTMELNRHRADINLNLHPRLVVRRDVTGTLHGVAGSVNGATTAPGEITESWIHVEVAGLGDRVSRAGLETELRRVLDDVRVTVEDQPKMIAAAASLAVSVAGDGAGPPLPGRTEPQPLDSPDTEAGELLSWLADGHFIFLGYREYDLVPGDDGEALRAVPGTGLGFLRHDRQGSESFAALPADIRAKAREPHRLVLAQGNSRSTVYRSKYLDYVSVKKLGRDGRVIGEWRFLGLYTHFAYTESIARIPVLRHKLTDVLTAAGITPDSHDGNDLIEILENYPREELFQISTSQLTEIATAVLRLRERKQTRLFLRRDAYGRYMSCLVYLPRDRYTTAVRLRVQEILRTALHGASVDYSAMVGESALARLHVVVRGVRGQPLPDVDAAALERRIAATVRTWDEDLEAEALRTLGPQRARLILDQFTAAIPETYKTDVTAADAVGDLSRILQLREAGDVVRGPVARRRPPRRRPVAAARVPVGYPRHPVRRAAPAAAHGARGGRRAPVRVRRQRQGAVLDLRLRAAGREDVLAETPPRRRREGAVRAGPVRAVAERDRGRRVQRAGPRRRADLARGRGAARVRPVPAPGRDPVQPGLHPAGAALEHHGDPAAGPSVRLPVRPGAAARRGRAQRGHRGGDPRGAGRGRQPGSRPDPPVLSGADRRHAADELLPRGRPGARPGRGTGLRHARERALPRRQARPGPGGRPCPRRGPRSRSSCTRPGWRPCTCGSAVSPGAGCAGRIGWRTSAPRCWGWSRRRR